MAWATDSQGIVRKAGGHHSESFVVCTPRTRGVSLFSWTLHLLLVLKLLENVQRAAGVVQDLELRGEKAMVSNSPCGEKAGLASLLHVWNIFEDPSEADMRTPFSPNGRVTPPFSV